MSTRVGVGLCLGIALFGLWELGWLGRALAQEDQSPPPPAAAWRAPVTASPPPYERPPFGPQGAPSRNPRTARNLIFVELLGNGAAYSVNYARFVSDNVMLRIGIDYFSLHLGAEGATSVSFLAVPLTASYLGIGSLDHKLELGLGLFVGAGAAAGSADNTTTAFGAIATAIVGYRYVPHDGGFTFNIGFTPFFSPRGFQAWFGIGFGAAF